jgi:hypothetical protein
VICFFWQCFSTMEPLHIFLLRLLERER